MSRGRGRRRSRPRDREQSIDKPSANGGQQSQNTAPSKKPQSGQSDHALSEGAARRGHLTQWAGTGDGNGHRPQLRFAAIDLGTNNCRLLIAAPKNNGVRIVDAFSRIVRLGEGISDQKVLSNDAMERTIDALKICAQKMAKRGVTHQRCIATQACRSAQNGEAFLARVRSETGLKFDIISTEEEAELALKGCRDLIDPGAGAALVFDIGGGSTEISFVRMRTHEECEGDSHTNPVPAHPDGWFSIPLGVVSLSEKWGGRDLTPAAYGEIVDHVAEEIRRYGDPAGVQHIFQSGEGHLLGTSGTVTSIAGVHLQLPRYRRDAVDGLWLSRSEAAAVSQSLLMMTNKERASEPCIGFERADLVVCGCAILDAILTVWPAERIRVADRGLREGILAGLAQKAKRRRRPRGRRGGKRDGQTNGQKPTPDPTPEY
ncbi:MAG: Ppx/GppA phosphatase family protein [Pseudomonadota bacterium]